MQMVYTEMRKTKINQQESEGDEGNDGHEGSIDMKGLCRVVIEKMYRKGVKVENIW